jgi:hypothetical protein
MKPLRSLLVGFTLLGLAPVPLFAQEKKDDPFSKDNQKKPAPAMPAPMPVAPPFIPPPPISRSFDGQKLIFVADGVGASTLIADNLVELAGDVGLPLRVQMLNWCRQDHKVGDFTDSRSQLQAACKLAGWVRMIRKDCGHADIYFVGPDAGARVVLAAAEMLPPRSVNRIILIGAGVSNAYDLRPALMATGGGIDHFWSTEDDFLERVVERRGTSDGMKGWAAGRVGFRPPPWCDPKGLELYRNLRQHKWQDGLCGQGGHKSWMNKHNIKKCILPLFFQPQITFASSMTLPPLPPPPPVLAPMEPKK